MEGVGARLGRSSTRYGPATVFNGPVRKWKKKWVHVSPSNASSNNNNNNNINHSQSHSNGTTSNGNNCSHLLLYKWTPITQSQNTNGNNSNNGDHKEEAPAPEEPPRRKFKYVPIALLEEQKSDAAENEGAEKVEDGAKPNDTDPTAVEPTHKSEILDEKPDINDVPMEESQSRGNNQGVRQDLNETTLDLSLGLNGHDDEHDSASKTKH